MFGAFRLVLALVVAAAHLGHLGGFAAGYAVHAFYALSGYLMCLIVNQRYAQGPRAFALFCLNRALRIYPLYWAACLVALALLAAFSAEALHAFHTSLRLPATRYEILSNALIFGLFPSHEARLVPPAWALHVELLFYLAIGLCLGRSRALAVPWLAVSAAYHGLALHFGWDRYYSAQAASLAFSAGACLYHFRRPLRRWLPCTAPALAAALAGYGALLVLQAWLGNRSGLPFYAGLALCALCLHLLSQWRARALLGIDERLGRLSYPVYLLHYHVAFLVHHATGIPRPSPTLFWVTLPLLLAAAAVAAALEEATVERWRKAIAARAERVRERRGGALAAQLAD
jgi:peptidoglycan/LPS O-acetylase OafA/YrhL